MTEITPADERKSNCPDCGAPATDDSIVEHRLSAMGYTHDDQMFQCSECGFKYAHGVPLGTPDMDVSDLWCDACDLGWMTVHRVHPKDDGATLHLKCGHHHDLTCPRCGEHIPPDGTIPQPDGHSLCPECAGHIERDELPYCYYFRMTTRSRDAAGRSLVGTPTITGSTENATPYGYDDEAHERGTARLPDGQ